MGRASLLLLAAASCLFCRSASAVEPVLTPATQPIVAAAMSGIPPPCGAALQSIQIQGSRILLSYDHPAFQITIVHPGATSQGQRVGPYRVIADASSACPEAASEIVAGLRAQSLADPWVMPSRSPDEDPARRTPDVAIAPREVRSWIGAVVLLLHLVVFGALIRMATRRGAEGTRSWWRVAPLGVALLAWVARLATPPFVFNWYSFTEESPPGFLVFAQGFVGLELALGRLWPSVAPMTAVVAFVRISGSLSAGVGVVLAEKVGLPRRTALVSGVLLAIWPALVRMGASDAQHPIALTLWLAFCLVWAKARERGGGRVAVLLLLGALLPLVRAETLTWIPAAIVLFPPGRRTPLVSWVALVVAGTTAAALALPLRGVIESSSGSIVGWIFSPLSASRGISVAPLVLGAFGALGLACLFASDRRLAARLLACALVVALPALVSGELPDNPLTIRYFLPLAVVLVLFSAVSLTALGGLLAPARPFAPLFGAVLLSISEAWAWLPSDAQYTFRHEAPFLRTAMSRLEPGATVCMLDPAMNHDWPGRHRDIDTAWSPRGGGRYYGIERRIVVVAEPRDDSRCDYYYAGATCALDLTDRRLGEDGERFRRACEAWRERVDSPPVATEERAPVGLGTRLGPGPVSLGLYRVRSSEP